MTNTFKHRAPPIQMIRLPTRYTTQMIRLPTRYTTAAFCDKVQEFNSGKKYSCLGIQYRASFCSSTHLIISFSIHPKSFSYYYSSPFCAPICALPATISPNLRCILTFSTEKHAVVISPSLL